LDPANVDTSFGAVIIADVGNSSFQGSQRGWFSLLYTHSQRVKILNKKGYDLANFNIPLYIGTQGDEERITSFRASTYTLENGKVVETKLSKDAKFTDKEDDHHILKKFTFPNVTDGCILEFSYTVTSDFFENFQPWAFQGEYPRLWSEYEADIPEFFIYDIQAQGYLPFDINTNTPSNTDYKITFNGNDNFSHPESGTLSSNNIIHRWVIKNVPTLKEEGFTSSISNYISKIEFQLSGIHFPNSPYRDYRSNWTVLSEKLLEASYFGQDLNRANTWMNEDLQSLKISGEQPGAKAEKIYEYVKSHIKWTGQNSYALSKSLSESFKNKSGNTADINLLLVAMLRHEKLNAEPVILSTRNHGFPSPIYPLIDRYNYVICRLLIDSNAYLLDASRPYLSFGKIPSFCFNGNAKIIKAEPQDIDLSSDIIRNVQISSIQLMSAPKSQGIWTGNFISQIGEFSSNNIRNAILEKGKAEYLKKIKESYRSDIVIDSLDIQEESNYANPLKINYKLVIKAEDDPNIIYLNPMMSEGYKTNPFKSAERKYPVEMPYTSDEIYSLRIQIPTGYKVDEIPKSAKVNLNGNDGYFEYLLAIDGEYIALRSRVKINKANFSPDDYQSLRNFYDLIVKKHAEQIVFKKI
jgi:hypothetical protein